MKTEYKRWQVVVWVTVFLALMGLAGREDMKAAQMMYEPLPLNAGVSK
jgi:hypothetical protein